MKTFYQCLVDAQRDLINHDFNKVSSENMTDNLELKALEKINHTICLNYNNKTLKFGIDCYDHIDCNNADEFIDCYNTIKSALERKEKSEKDLEVLDLVRKLFVYDDYCGFGINFKKLKPKEREKVKEWLLEKQS